MGAKAAKQEARNENNYNEMPSMTYNYPYYPQPQPQAYPNLVCMPPPPPQLQPAQQPPTHIQATITKLPPYQSSQSVAFDHWQFSGRPMNPNLNTMSTMNINTLPKPVMHRAPYEQPKFEIHTLKYQMPPQLACSPPPPPPLPQILHHPHSMPTPSYIPIHSSHHQQPFIPPYHNRRNSNSNSSSTVNSSKSSSSFSSLS